MEEKETSVRQSRLSIQQKAYNEFRETTISLPNPVQVKMGEFVEVPDDRNIVHEGAAPCLIVFIHDDVNKTIITGHFPIAGHKAEEIVADSMKEGQAFARELSEEEKVVIFDAEQFSEIAADELRLWQVYSSLLKRLQTINKNHLEVHLFGQGTYSPKSETPEDLDHLKQSFLVNLQVIVDIMKTGIKRGAIFDHRDHQDPSCDFTAYLARTKEIIYARLKDESPPNSFLDFINDL